MKKLSTTSLHDSLAVFGIPRTRTVKWLGFGVALVRWRSLNLAMCLYSWIRKKKWIIKKCSSYRGGRAPRLLAIQMSNELTMYRRMQATPQTMYRATQWTQSLQGNRNIKLTSVKSCTLFYCTHIMFYCTMLIPWIPKEVKHGGLIKAEYWQRHFFWKEYWQRHKTLLKCQLLIQHIDKNTAFRLLVTPVDN